MPSDDKSETIKALKEIMAMLESESNDTTPEPTKEYDLEDRICAARAKADEFIGQWEQWIEAAWNSQKGDE